MDNKEMVVIQKNDGTTMNVELVTYLVSEDGLRRYLVYSKGEKTGVEADEVIYIAKMFPEGETIKIDTVSEDNDWAEVQKVLKKIANA